MTDELTRNLKAALAAAPDNVELRMLLLRTLLAQGAAAELDAVVAPLAAAQLASAADRRTAAEAHRACGNPAAALEFLDADEEPETLLLRARVLLALDRLEEGRRCYDAAVAANAALEDGDLKRALSAKVRVFNRAGQPALKVIANDDTDATEVARLLAPPQEKITFADVGGLAEVKKQIHRRIILPFQKPSLFERFKKRAGGGILLYGPPGCGKTLLARATAGEVDARFFAVSISDVLDMYIGESERKLHALFETARNSAPAVLFFDEVEALGGKRQYTRESTSSKLVSQFLAEMDGFAQNNAGVLILGATNVPWAVDPAFRRPGRFDRVVFIPPPDREARQGILERLLAAVPSARDIDTGFLAAHTSGFSGADLRELVDTAVDEAIEESIAQGREAPVTMAHLRTALAERKPTTLEWLTTARNYARYSNESGQYDEVLKFLDKHARS